MDITTPLRNGTLRYQLNYVKQWHLISPHIVAATENSTAVAIPVTDLGLQLGVATTSFPRYISIQLIA
jgi:hypothetical protein